MIQKLKVTFLFVTVLAASSCSELEDAVDRNLSTNQITYKVETLNEWNKVESSAKQARTRAAMPADGDVVKRVNGWSGPLYLHALEEPGIHIRDYKDRPVNKQGQLLADENTGRIIATRGSKVTGASLTDFGINVKRVSSDNSAETFIGNEEVNTVVGSKYKTSDDHFWPSDNTSLSFYGYYPYNSGNYSSYISVNNTGTTPVVTYKSTAGKTSATATEVKAQPDLCVAVKTGETRPSTSATPDAVNMTFDHALTAITFAVGSDMVPGTFKSITISGVYLEGDYTYDSGWSTANKPTGSITLNLGTDGNGIKRSSKEAVALTGNDSTLLMVPQKVPSDATISMVFDDGKSVNTFTANIGGTEWTAGSTIIYKLSTKAVNNMTLGTISFPDTWKDAGYPKTDYDSGESMGLYSVDDLGNLRAQNVKITCKITDNVKSWIPEKSVRFSPAFKYFVYYPFNESMSLSSVTSTATTAEEFFGNYSSSFQVAANQSTANDLEKNDLQVGMGTADNTGSKVEFSSMEHSMGLAHVKFVETSVVAARLFNSSGAKLRDVGTATVYACETFTPNSYSASNHNFLRIGKPGSISFTPSSSSTFTWDKNSVALTANTASTLNVSCTKEYEYKGTPGYTYAYTGSEQTFTTPTSSPYLVECWGAQGGNMDMYSGGKGGYVAGIIPLTSGTILYAYVGGQAQAFNGAGISSSYEIAPHYGNSGGGATDFRLVKGSTWKEFTSLKSRIIVAAGGGGANYRNIEVDNGNDTYCIYGEGNGGYGGGLTGGEGQNKNNSRTNYVTYGWAKAYGGTQTSGGIPVATESFLAHDAKTKEILAQYVGKFGYCTCGETVLVQSGGGSGYYGGSVGNHGGGAGGSSFISGHSGCNAISVSSTESNIIHTGQANHYSGYVFTNTVMKAGNESMPSPSGGTETGHSGNGYAIITQVSY